MTTVHNAVAPEVVRRREDVRDEFGVSDIPLIAVVGRLAEQKNHAFVLDVAIALRQIGQPFRVLLIGDGSLRRELAHAIAQKDLRNHVELLGTRADVVDIVSAADAFLMTSRWEGLPLAMLEAMAVRTPVVATAVRGVVEIVRHEHSGLLVDEGNPLAAAATITRLLNDPDLGARLADAGARDVTQYSVPRMVDGYAAVYRSVLKGQN
ncbi:MAG: hypothetical protein QOH16_2156 [Gaiellaceae bacterium]|nr:hypothetical protein [Gaiellaceae bacterium]